MQQGYETFTSHTFREYCVISLGIHGKTIIDFIREHPRARVLDIGCGDGNALKELIKTCKQNGYTAEFTGLDLSRQKPKDFPGDAKYVSADISELDVTGFKLQFDLIISVNVFPYIIHKEKALSNVSKMLSANGKAFISIEPYYFGPYGTQLFNNSSCCEWDKDYRNILVRGTFAPVVIKEESFCEYELPGRCFSRVYQRLGKQGEPTIMLPIPECYSSDVEDSFLAHYGVNKEELIEKGRATNWDLFEFLSVKTPNHNGHHLCGTEGFRPFMFGILTPYFRGRGLSPEAVAVLIMMSELYDQHSRKSDWQEGQSFKFAHTCCLESLRLIGHNCLTEDEQQEIQKSVQAEVDLARLNTATHIFSPKSIIQLTVVIAILAAVIKVLLNLQPTTPGLGR